METTSSSFRNQRPTTPQFGAWALAYVGLTDPIFAWLERPDHAAVTSTITMTELLVQPYRDSGEQGAGRFYALLSTYPNLDWIAPDLAVADIAARIRAAHRVRPPARCKLRPRSMLTQRVWSRTIRFLRLSRRSKRWYWIIFSEGYLTPSPYPSSIAAVSAGTPATFGKGCQKISARKIVTNCTATISPTHAGHPPCAQKNPGIADPPLPPR